MGISTHYRLLRAATRALFVVVPLVFAALSAAQSPEPATGEALFAQQCGTCHSIIKGDLDRAGPSLFAVVGRTAGKLAGYEYSPALKNSTFTWDAAALDRWLTDPRQFVPDSYMDYRQADPAKRKAIIAYLLGNPGG
jgi:cytochrome c